MPKICAPTRSRSERYINFKELWRDIGILQEKEKKNKYYKKENEDVGLRIYDHLRTVTELESESPNPILPFVVVQRRELNGLREGKEKLQTALDEKGKEIKDQKKKLQETIDRERIQAEEETRNLKEELNRREKSEKEKENKIKRLQETIDRERIQAEKETRNLKEELNRLEKSEKEKDNEIKRLQETIDRERIQAEEETRNLKEELNRREKSEKEKENEIERLLTLVDEKEENIKAMELNIERKRIEQLQQHEQLKAVFQSNFEKLQDDLQKQILANEKLHKHLSDERKAKENALNRLSAAAANRLRDQNPGITDLSDPNRPLKLAEKVSELYDNEWTNAIENLEDMNVKENKGIKILLKIIQNVFDTCSEFGDIHLQSFPDLLVLPPAIYQPKNDRVLRVENVSSDLLKPMKDFRKSNAKHTIACLKEFFLTKEGKSRLKIKKEYLDPCKEYIEKCVEICWMMRVQDPPIHMDASYPTNSQFDSTKMRSFTKAGQFIQFVVWPTFFLHKDGPLLAKGVVQGSKTKVTQEESCSSSSDSSDEDKFDDARSRAGSEPAAEMGKDDAQEGTQPLSKNNEPTASNGETFDNSHGHEGNGSTNPETAELENGGTEQNGTENGGSTNDDVIQFSGEEQEEKGEKEEEDAKSSSSQQTKETPKESIGNQGCDSETKAAGDQERKPHSHDPSADDQADTITPLSELSAGNTAGNLENKRFVSDTEETSTGGGEGGINESFTDEQVLDP